MNPQDSEFISIPGSTFLMGSDNGAEDERPVHTVTLDSFLIGKFPVTNREYDEFLNASGYKNIPPYRHDPDFCDPKQPVIGISWFDAMEYCKWRNVSLPTEAEWEFAARCGSEKNIYPWGTKNWEQLPELHHRFQDGPEPVGSFEPNAWGIFDMGINVHEWCLDWYDASYYSVSPARNPTGPSQGKRRASRGGSWRHMIKITRCSARSSIPPEFRYADYGFRIKQSAGILSA